MLRGLLRRLGRMVGRARVGGVAVSLDFLSFSSGYSVLHAIVRGMI